jgi:hypothetical protein
VGLLRRNEPPEEAPEIHVANIAGMGTISGRRVSGEPQPEGYVGSFLSGRSATGENLRAARNWFVEIPAQDFEWLDGGREVADRGSGLVYEVLISDPLLADDPRESGVTAFFVNGDRLEFLRSTGTTVADRERAVQAQAERVAVAEEERVRQLAKAKQTSIPLSVMYGERMQMSVREAAAKILEAGGQVGANEIGGVRGLRITVPEKLNTEPLMERMAWAEVAVAAEVLTSCARVVLAALDEVAADGSKRPRTLLERLPDRQVCFGGVA